MRRRIGLMSVVAGLLAVTIASAPVAAGNTYVWSLSNASCYLNGGAYGEGYVKGRAYIEENGRSGTRYFYITARLQERSLSGGGWYNIDSKVFSSYTFPNDYSTYFISHTFKINVANNYNWHRIQIFYEWYGNGGRVWYAYSNGPKC